MSGVLDPLLLQAPLFEGRPGGGGAPAFLHGSQVLSYGGLAQDARRGAAWLAGLGIGAGDRVAIALGKGLTTVRLIYSILSAGAALVPLDPAAPTARLGAQLGDCRPRLLLTGGRLLERLAAAGALADTQPLAIDGPADLETLLADADLNRPLPVLTAQAPALLLYTSGTTGTPKAVVLSHANVTSFTRWAIETLGLVPGDRLAAHAPLWFDLATLDLFAATRAGAASVILDEVAVRFPARVSEIVSTAGVTVWYPVPTALALLVEHGALAQRDLTRLRLILFAGEPFPIPMLRRLMQALPWAQYVNLYGPTETNVCTYHRLTAPPPADALAIPIGRPCEHLAVSPVRPDGTATATGELGEILVRGPAVMQGYWGNAALTQASRCAGDPASYLTGDLGYRDGEGRLWLQGRRDHQIKIRGHRLELAEVAAILERCPGVAQAAALTIARTAGRADPDRDPVRLVAAVAPLPGVTPDPAALRRQCREWLPAYAVPGLIRIMPQLPRTPTGKLDREGLRATFDPQPHTGDNHVEPPDDR